jgi:hypothetical protein
MSATHTKKTHTAAEVDSMLAAEPKVTALTCQQLCQERANDVELLQDLDEFPVKLRAQVRASLMRSLATIAMEMKSQKCPACSE